MLSKNSGPFELTLDIIFDTKEAYDRVKNENIFTNECIDQLFHLTNHGDIITNIFFEAALAWKCTKRPREQGRVVIVCGAKRILIPQAKTPKSQSRGSYCSTISIILWMCLLRTK